MGILYRNDSDDTLIANNRAIKHDDTRFVNNSSNSSTHSWCSMLRGIPEYRYSESIKDSTGSSPSGYQRAVGEFDRYVGRNRVDWDSYCHASNQLIAFRDTQWDDRQRPCALVAKTRWLTGCDCLVLLWRSDSADRNEHYALVMQIARLVPGGWQSLGEQSRQRAITT